MKSATQQKVDLKSLMREVCSYLAAVDAFRAEGHEPRWRRELPDIGETDTPCRLAALGAPPIP